MKKIKKFRKYIISAVALIFSLVLFVVFYYRFDPSLLTQLSFYTNLANPFMRIVQVQEGMRKEQVAQVLADRLDWTEQDKATFIDSADVEGHYFPETYLIYKDEDPSAVIKTMTDEFNKQVSTIKKPKSANIINENAIITIASIVQREAASKDDMNLISGIIWNRLFNGMKLQIDATVQYADGSEANGWWGPVTPADISIKSAYNTYQNTGLPPGPIANPGLAAIAAAYNPTTTNCLYYLHDKNKNIHCAATYAQHLKNIAMYLN